MSPLARIRRIPPGLHGLFIMRVYDGFDHCWYDCTGPLPLDEAMTEWNRETKDGTEKIGYSSGGSYYKLFPADTVMARRPETAFPPGSNR